MKAFHVISATHPIDKGWKTEKIIRELLDKAGDLLCADARQRFDIVMNDAPGEA